MPASLDKQISAMDSLAWRVTYEWNQAKNNLKTMAEMHKVYQDLCQSAKYQCLADKRKESIRFLWQHTRVRIQAENQIHGRWYDGRFYAHWCDLPESIRYDNAALAKLPSGHFWADKDRQATAIRYFISSDCAGEDAAHFLPLPAVAAE